MFSLFPAVEQIIDGKKILFSHPGATVGSFSLPENLSIADALCLGGQLIKYAKGKKFQSIKNKLTSESISKKTVKLYGI